jgi:hypothetical protein
VDRRSKEQLRLSKCKRKLLAKKGLVPGEGETMATKASFTPEEWTLLLEAPMLAGMAVTAAEPSGLVGVIQESLAAGNALVQVNTDAAANPLVKAVAAEFSSSEGRTAARDGIKARFASGNPGELKTRALEALGRVSTLLVTKAPEDAPAFKAWLTGIAQRVAEAAKEGGFLGFGGVQVSQAEMATLAEIGTALA